MTDRLSGYHGYELVSGWFRSDARVAGTRRPQMGQWLKQRNFHELDEMPTYPVFQHGLPSDSLVGQITWFQGVVDDLPIFCVVEVDWRLSRAHLFWTVNVTPSVRERFDRAIEAFAREIRTAMGLPRR